MPAIVTKQLLNVLLNQADDDKKIRIVGRALVALFERQTEAEQSTDTTQNHNGIGFASCDARSGSLTAKSFLKNRTLAKWQLDRWMAPQKDGFPRICKYVKQLSEIAEEKERKLHKQLEARYSQLCVSYGECVDSDDPKILEPILTEMKAIETRLGNVPYRIGGSVVN
jgi:hypothetical protein